MRPPSSRAAIGSVLMVVLVAALIVAMAHVAAVWSDYHPFSFYDDAHYALTAQNIAHGLGLVDTSRPGNPPDTVYPPGYPLLLAPLVLAFPSSTVPIRVLSTVLYACVLLMTYRWLIRREAGRPLVVAVTMVLLALNPMAATYGGMIMAEMAFLVAITGLLVASSGWDRDRQLSWWGAASVAALTAAVYLKSAGWLLVPGAALYYAIRRRWLAALACALGPLLFYAPVLLHNLRAGQAAEGSSYGQQISLFDGPAAVVSQAVRDLRDYTGSAFADAIVDVRPFAGAGEPWATLLTVPSLVVFPLVVLGVVLAGRRCFDLSVVLVPVYFLGTLLYQYTNERRVVLVLPVVLYWVVCGIDGTARAVCVRLSSPRPRQHGRSPGAVAVARTTAVFTIVLFVVPVLPQFGRDYRFFTSDTGMRPLETPSLGVLSAVGQQDVVVAARPVYTVRLITGHKSRPLRLRRCGPPSSIWRAYRRRRAGFLTLGDYHRPPGHIGDDCLVNIMDAQPQRYVVLYRDPAEPSVTYQIIGPGTPFPTLRDVVHDKGLIVPTGHGHPELEQALTDSGPPRYFVSLDSDGGRAVAESRFGAAAVTQVSVVAAGNRVSAPREISVSLHVHSGWQVIYSVRGQNVGPLGGRSPTPGEKPFILVRLPHPTSADAVKVVFTGSGQFELHDLHVLAINSI